MNEKKAFYITTTLPYLNGKPHIGHASEFVLADVRFRFARECGYESFFNTGTDEHGAKIYRKAIESNMKVEDYVDEIVKNFKAMKNILNLDYTKFIRTTDEHHKLAAKELWNRVKKNGFIYKKHYQIRYCVGCELEKTDSELKDDKCPFHPNKELELIDEENYFFKFSEFSEVLLKHYNDNSEFVYPTKRFNEIKVLAEKGFKDFSISRLKEKMPWGIAVPGDENQVMYVWFDALTNYIATLGWPDDEKNFQKFWGKEDESKAVQIAGKDNLRQQSAMWQAMLLAADLPMSKQIFINGFIGVNGQKMSKSIGNVITPEELVERYGIDGTRYLLLTKSNFGEDSDISWSKMDEKYNADLANGLGNLVSRIITLANDINYEIPLVDIEKSLSFDIELFEMKKALEKIWSMIDRSNKLMEERQPWILKKKDDIFSKKEYKELMERFLQDLHIIAILIKVFLPETSEKILTQIKTRKKEILFERIK